MKNKMSGVISLMLFSSVSVTACSLDFSQQIKVISLDKRADVDIPASLFEISSFRDAIGCSAKHKANAITFISSSLGSEKEKMIAAFSLQSLSGDDYVDFLERITDAFEKKKINKNIFNAAVFPGLEWSTYLQHSYNQPRVRQLLHRIKNIEGYENKFMDATISGELKNATAEPN